VVVVVVVGTCAKVSAQALWFSWASRVNLAGPVQCAESTQHGRKWPKFTHTTELRPVILCEYDRPQPVAGAGRCCHDSTRMRRAVWPTAVSL
jgi:hypothetical protein